MSEFDFAISLREQGLFTEALGPPREWSPEWAEVHQKRHDQFWRLVETCIIPEDEDDEPWWMGTGASNRLKYN